MEARERQREVVFGEAPRSTWVERGYLHREPFKKKLSAFGRNTFEYKKLSDFLKQTVMHQLYHLPLVDRLLTKTMICLKFIPRASERFLSCLHFTRFSIGAQRINYLKLNEIIKRVIRSYYGYSEEKKPMGLTRLESVGSTPICLFVLRP